MRDRSDTFIVLLAASVVLVVFALGIGLGYSYGTKDTDELKAEKAVMQFTRLSEDLKEAVAQRDECRRFVREWAAPVRGVRENRTTQK